MYKELGSTRVMRQIICSIFSGAYKNGQKLPGERRLCRQFGVSRGTIRLALANLRKLGIIKVRACSGSYVQKFSNTRLPEYLLPPNFRKVSVRDIIVARKAVELTAVDLACEHITKDELSLLEELVDKMEGNVGNLVNQLEFDMNFHETIVRASNNLAFITAFEGIYDYHKYVQIFSSQNEKCEQIAAYWHHEVLDALQKADKKLCRQAMSNHLNCVEDYHTSESGCVAKY
jgi:GntR family transcriptional repressor for pyruvate dehydrogenase complex